MASQCAVSERIRGERNHPVWGNRLVGFVRDVQVIFKTALMTPLHMALARPRTFYEPNEDTEISESLSNTGLSTRRGVLHVRGTEQVPDPRILNRKPGIKNSSLAYPNDLSKVPCLGVPSRPVRLAPGGRAGRGLAKYDMSPSQCRTAAEDAQLVVSDLGNVAN